MTIPYQPLDPSHPSIRLLTFDPPSQNPTDKDDTISLTLHHTSLSISPKPTYNALSYVWATPSTSPTPLPTIIKINSLPLRTTPNLFAALRTLQHSNLAAGFLWIDALCINQRDVAEREQQVRLMGRIYAEAEGVLAWLGEGEGMVASARLAFAVTKALARGVRLMVGAVGGGGDDERVLVRAQGEDPLLVAAALSVALEEMGGLGAPTRGVQDAVLEVFWRNEYWKRCWTFQELYLAEYGALLCGTETVSMRDAWLVFRWLRLAKTAIVGSARPEGVSELAWGFLRNMADVLDGFPLYSSMLVKERLAGKRHEIDEAYNEGNAFSTLLAVTLGRQATEPRDRFYSLLGLCNASIPVDYSASEEDVFGGVTAALIHGGRASAGFVLDHAGVTGPKGAYALPSWMPHWDVSLVAGSMDSGKTSSLGRSDTGFPEPKSPPFIDGRMLRCRGVIIDTIARVEAGWDVPTGYILDESVRPNLDLARGVLDELVEFFFDCPVGAFLSELVPSSEPYVGGGTRFLALLRYWVHDRGMNGEVFGCATSQDLEGEDIARLAKQFLMFIGLRPRDMARIMEMGRPLNSWSDKAFLTPSGGEEYTWDQVLLALPTNDDPAVIDFLLRRVLRFLVAARLRTATGFIGHARNGIEPGDVVCILDGCNVPVVLRPRPGDDGYELASCAFVVGMMDGEAGKLVERGERTVCDITIW